MYSTMPPAFISVPVCARMSFTSPVEATVALTLYSDFPPIWAMMSAIVVLPVPGGP